MNASIIIETPKNLAKTTSLINPNTRDSIVIELTIMVEWINLFVDFLM
jgi:hypothetical protein